MVGPFSADNTSISWRSSSMVLVPFTAGALHRSNRRSKSCFEPRINANEREWTQLQNPIPNLQTNPSQHPTPNIEDPLSGSGGSSLGRWMLDVVGCRFPRFVDSWLRRLVCGFAAFDSCSFVFIRG